MIGGKHVTCPKKHMLLHVAEQAWRLSGDQYVEKGGKPWISEMYGYVYAAAKMDVWHKASRAVFEQPVLCALTDFSLCPPHAAVGPGLHALPHVRAIRWAACAIHNQSYQFSTPAFTSLMASALRGLRPPSHFKWQQQYQIMSLRSQSRGTSLR